jgi:NADH dehydrogenase
MGRRRVLLPVPFPAWEAQASVMSLLPKPPLTRSQVALMKRDNVVGPGALTFSDLGITPTPVEAILPMYVG